MYQTLEYAIQVWSPYKKRDIECAIFTKFPVRLCIHLRRNLRLYARKVRSTPATMSKKHCLSNWQLCCLLHCCKKSINVEATFYFVEATFDNVARIAPTLLLVWTGFKSVLTQNVRARTFVNSSPYLSNVLPMAMICHNDKHCQCKLSAIIFETTFHIAAKVQIFGRGGGTKLGPSCLL